MKSAGVAGRTDSGLQKWVPVRRRVGNGEVFLVGDAAAQ